MDGRTKLRYAVFAVAALIFAAGVGAVTALATANALDDDARLARSEQPRFALPDLDERRLDDRGSFDFGRPQYFRAVLDLEAAASYLGLTVEELHGELADGNSLADVARDEGKSVHGLVAALVDAGEESIDDAVMAGRITEEHGDELKEDLDERIRDRVNDEFRLPRPFGFDREFEWPRGFNG